jgi:hypothetical protein
MPEACLRHDLQTSVVQATPGFASPTRSGRGLSRCCRWILPPSVSALAYRARSCSCCWCRHTSGASSMQPLAAALTFGTRPACSLRSSTGKRPSSATIVAGAWPRQPSSARHDRACIRGQTPPGCSAITSAVSVSYFGRPISSRFGAGSLAPPACPGRDLAVDAYMS